MFILTFAYANEFKVAFTGMNVDPAISSFHNHLNIQNPTASITTIHRQLFIRSNRLRHCTMIRRDNLPHPQKLFHPCYFIHSESMIHTFSKLAMYLASLSKATFKLVAPFLSISAARFICFPFVSYMITKSLGFNVTSSRVQCASY